VKLNKVFKIILIIIFCFIFIINFTITLSLHQQIKFLKTKYEVYQNLINSLKDIQKTDPAIGGLIRSVEDRIEKANTLDDLSNLLVSIENIYDDSLLEHHGIEKYNLRFKFFKYPFRKIENNYEIDNNVIVTSEYGSRWLKLRIAGKLKDHLIKYNIKNGYKGFMTLPKWGYCNVKVYKEYLLFEQIHSGIDLVTESNYIYAAAKGFVSEVGYSKVWGKYIKTKHYIGDVWYELGYAHLSYICVKKGQKITSITHIGIVGNTGLTLGEHLHFSIKVYDNKRRKYYTVNPYTNSTYNKPVCTIKYNRFM